MCGTQIDGATSRWVDNDSGGSCALCADGTYDSNKIGDDDAQGRGDCAPNTVCGYQVDGVTSRWYDDGGGSGGACAACDEETWASGDTHNCESQIECGYQADIAHTRRGPELAHSPVNEKNVCDECAYNDDVKSWDVGDNQGDCYEIQTCGFQHDFTEGDDDDKTLYRRQISKVESATRVIQDKLTEDSYNSWIGAPRWNYKAGNDTEGGSCDDCATGSYAANGDDSCEKWTECGNQYLLIGGAYNFSTRMDSMHRGTPTENRKCKPCENGSITENDNDGHIDQEGDCHPRTGCRCPHGTASAYLDNASCFLAQDISCDFCNAGHRSVWEIHLVDAKSFPRSTCVKCPDGHYIDESNHNEEECKPHTVRLSEECTEGQHLVQGTHLKDTACEDKPVWFQGEGDDVIYVSTTTTIAPNCMGLVLLLLPLILL